MRPSTRAFLGAASFSLALAFPVLAQAPATASQGDEEYVAQPGDTMNGISQRLLHEGETPRVQRALQQHNRLSDPDVIHPGQVIRIPRAWLKSRESAVVVVAVQGDVRSKGQAVSPNAKLTPGDDLRTGKDSYATLKLADGSTLTLLPSGNAGLERAQATPGGTTDTQFRLDAGRAETTVQKAPKGNTRFEVRTPMAIAAVRGTKFRVVVDEQKNAMMSEVVEGEVAVSDSGNLGTASVRGGFGTRVSAGSAPLAPRALLPAPFLWTGVQLVERPEFNVQVTPLRGAQSYRLFVSAREDFSSVMREEVLKEPLLRFASLQDGDYFVRLRGIDDIELEGQDTTARMRVRIRPAAPAPTSPPNRGSSRGTSLEFTWQPQAEAESYLLQVARDPAFRDMLGDWGSLREPRYQAVNVPSGTYFWRVAYTQADGKRSLFSETRSFQLKAAPQPPNAAKVEDDVVLITWPSEPGQSFELEFASDPGFTRILEQRKTKEPRASLPRPAAGTYHVRVRATDADGTVGPYTEAMRVDVKRKEVKPVCIVEGPKGICAVYGPTPGQ